VALWFVLRVNDQGIGAMSIRRVSGTDHPLSTNTYEVEVDGGRAGEVTHVYGDDVWKLVNKAVALVVEEKEAAPMTE
jgi:hypothetical protein